MTEQRETEQQRLTRNVNELLAELRVAQAGVQILFGFLLAVVFTPMFAEAELLVKVLHLAAVLLAVLATALDRKSTRLNSSHVKISYAVFCLKKKSSETSARCCD